MKTWATFALVVVLTGFAFAADQPSLAEKVREGNELFERGDYEAARQKYADAQIDAPENAELQFNQGDVLYRQGKYDKAIAAFQAARATPYPLLESKCHYNIGDCLVQQGKLKEALEAYKRALQLNRDDEDTKYNIEYVQRKLKELASKKKEEQEKDPLNKLLKELERLISLQSANLVETKKLDEWCAVGDTNELDVAGTVHGLHTNEQCYAEKTMEIREGFRDLRTNLPPEKLYGMPAGPAGPSGAAVGAGPQGAPQQVSLDEPMRDLVGIFQLLAQAAEHLSASSTGKDQGAVAPALSKIEQALEQAENETNDKSNKQFAAAGRECLKDIQAMFESPRNATEDATKRASEQFNSLMQNIQSELNTRARTQLPGMVGGTNGTQKTLAQKIDNAVGFLATAKEHIDLAAGLLDRNWTNAPPDQAVGLEFLIKARKEFDDKNQQQQGQQEQKQQKQDQKDKKKDKKKQDQKKDDQQKQDKQKEQDKQKQDKQRDQQQKEPQPQPKLDKKQVRQMLKNFKEDQRNRRKARKKKMKASGYTPVDKDW